MCISKSHSRQFFFRKNGQLLSLKLKKLQWNGNIQRYNVSSNMNNKNPSTAQGSSNLLLLFLVNNIIHEYTDGELELLLNKETCRNTKNTHFRFGFPKRLHKQRLFLSDWLNTSYTDAPANSNSTVPLYWFCTTTKIPSLGYIELKRATKDFLFTYTKIFQQKSFQQQHQCTCHKRYLLAYVTEILGHQMTKFYCFSIDK